MRRKIKLITAYFYSKLKKPRFWVMVNYFLQQVKPKYVCKNQVVHSKAIILENICQKIRFQSFAFSLKN